MDVSVGGPGVDDKRNQSSAPHPSGVPEQIPTNIQSLTDVDKSDMDDSATQVVSVKLTQSESNSANPEAKLFGWLQILTRGIIKTNRQRFCVFGDNTCKLYVYRNQHDFLPLDEIDISRASFHFNAGNTGKPGSFEIRSGGKEHLLDASDRHSMMFWLQELQKRRRIFNMARNSLSRDRLGQWNFRRTQGNISGLVSKKDEVDMDVETSHSDFPLIKAPTSLLLGPPEGTTTNSLWSFTNLKSELQNAFSNIKGQIDSTVPRQLSESASPSPSQEDIVSPDGSTPTLRHASISSVKPGGKVGKFKSAFGKVLARKSVISDEEAPPSVCNRCKLLQKQLTNAQQDQQATDEELQANREIVRLLQKELDSLTKEMETRFQMSTQDREGFEGMLKERDKHIVELKFGLASMKEEKELLAQQFRTKSGELCSIQDQLKMFEDMLAAKDETIIKLTNNLTEAEKVVADGKANGYVDISPSIPPTDSLISNSTPIPAIDTREIQRLKDMCAAYETQNKFLTNEILELTDLRQHDEDNAKTLAMSYAQLEAKFYQTHSKYLILLQEFKQPVRGEDDIQSQEMVTQLLSDALDLDENEDMDYLFTTSGQEYDRYGFLKKYGGDEDEDPLIAKATELERKSAELSTKIKEADEVTSHLVKWDNFMVGQTGKTLVRSAELKGLVRMGVPHEHRSHIWKGCVNFYVSADRDKLGPHYYKGLITRSGDTPHNPAAKQIELDLLRTLPNNKYYESSDLDGVAKLRRVLVAYSLHNPVIGYCQGLNRLVAIGLLFLEEEEAFWLIVAIVEHIMPKDYYSKTLIAAQADQRVLKDMVQDKLPRLYTHFETHNVDLSLFTFNWFLTIFVDNIPPETFLRVWDAYLYEGSKMLFRFAVAFFKMAEEEILQQNSALGVNHYMRVIGEKMTDVRRISQFAFNWINPFPMRSISTKRQFYLQQLRCELAELDKLRDDIRSQRVTSDCREFFSDDEL
ncbi:TBC1 domain family member 2B-like [Ylistrum balloti]|uniref:TBC1 domain family member 2B-like n=1 Tax=Ylistrum balloti TaxID=509963 RepID=UPI002905EF63|nr:TBC1 domain family member 2B-like [Ylistrum balloti]